MTDNIKTVSHLDVPFKEFMPGQIIKSEQFNDDMVDIEDKINEVIDVQNSSINTVKNHITNQSNPHGVTAEQVGSYTISDVDSYIDDLKNGELNDGVITNRLMAGESVDTHNIVDYSITLAKLDKGIGSQIDLSGNTSITSAYSKEEIDAKFEEYQAGTIIDGTIGIDKLKDNVGKELDITSNPSIINKYTKSEVDLLISTNGMPKNWGSISSDYHTEYWVLPVTDLMVADSFVIEESNVLDLEIKEVVDARGVYGTLGLRVDAINESKLDDIVLEGNDLIIKSNGVALKTITLPTSSNVTDFEEYLNGLIGGEY